MFQRLFFVFLIALFILGGNSIHPSSALAESTVALTGVQSGDLIRGESFSAVYYLGEDGFRYVFPNDKTYFTWYENFDDVKWLSDADLGTIQIGGNVTYRPGSKMIKINSDPKTYAIGKNGSLHWINSEEVAKTLYGNDWNQKIDDVPDGFFSNYSTSENSTIEDASTFDITYVESQSPTINVDKSLEEPTVITISDSNYSSDLVTIQSGEVIRFENKGTTKHTATADDLSWGTGTIESGSGYNRYFNTKGTYTYFDSYNSNLTGTIIVE